MRTLSEIQNELDNVVLQMNAIGEAYWTKRFDPRFQKTATALSTRFNTLVEEKTKADGYAGKKMIVDLAYAGIGEGHEFPAKKHYPAMPGEIDEEAPRRF